MGTGLIALQLVVMSSTVTASAADAASSTVADALGLDDLPLSEEDLALLEALDTETPTVAEHPPWWPPPDGAVRRVARVRLIEPVARSIAESFEALPTRVGTVRSGRRVSVLVDGVRIDPILPDAGRLWLSRDARLTSSVGLSASADLARDPRTHVGAIDVQMWRPSNTGVEASAFARTADRSAGAFAAGGVAGDAGYAGIAVYGARQGSLRIQTITASAELPAAQQRFGATARAAHAITDWAAVSAGLDFETADPDGPRGYQLLGFVRGALQGQRGEAEVRYAYVRYDSDVVLRSARVDRVDASGAFFVTDHLTAIGGGALAFGRVDLSSLRQDQLEGFVGLRLDTDAIDGELVARWVDATSTELDGREVTTSVPLFGGHVTWQIAEPLALRVKASQGSSVLPPAYVAAGFDDHERSFTAEVGPLLTLDDLWLSAHLFSTWLTDTTAFDRDAGTLVSRDGSWYGAEATGAWSITDALSIAGLVALTRPVTDGDVRIDGVPSVRWFGSVRYDIWAHDLFFSAFARGVTTPLFDEAPRAIIDPTRLNGPLGGGQRFGASAGLGVGYGLTVRATVENALDEVVVHHNRVAPGSGVDLRVALDWSY